MDQRPPEDDGRPDAHAQEENIPIRPFAAAKLPFLWESEEEATPTPSLDIMQATEAEEEECSLQMEVIREHNNNNQSDEIKMDSVDVVNTLIDIILDEVSRNKVAHMVEYLCPFANVNSAFFHSVPLLFNCFHWPLSM